MIKAQHKSQDGLSAFYSPDKICWSVFETISFAVLPNTDSISKEES